MTAMVGRDTVRATGFTISRTRSNRGGAFAVHHHQAGPGHAGKAFAVPLRQRSDDLTHGAALRLHAGVAGQLAKGREEAHAHSGHRRQGTVVTRPVTLGWSWPPSSSCPIVFPTTSFPHSAPSAST